MIYYGLPDDLNTNVFWFNNPNKTDILSYLKDGSDVIVEYQNGKTEGYHWVKNPSIRIMKIFQEQFFTNGTIATKGTVNERLNVICKNVHRIFVRYYAEGQFAEVPFTEVWSSDRDFRLPWLKIEDFSDSVNIKKLWEVSFEKLIIEERHKLSKIKWYRPKTLKKWHLQ